MLYQTRTRQGTLERVTSRSTRLQPGGFRGRPASRAAGTAPYARRHRWTISATCAALGLALVMLAGAAGSVTAGAGPHHTTAAHAIYQNSDPAVLVSRMAPPSTGHAALLPALLLLLIPIRRGAACRNRRRAPTGRLEKAPRLGRGPPTVAPHIG